MTVKTERIGRPNTNYLGDGSSSGYASEWQKNVLNLQQNSLAGKIVCFTFFMSVMYQFSDSARLNINYITSHYLVIVASVNISRHSEVGNFDDQSGID